MEGLEMVIAIAVIITGLYAITFDKSAATWAAGVDRELVHINFREGIYRIGLRVMGASFISLGVSTILLMV